ncbi:MAG: YaiI/YqxD family protein [Bosea sp. (in: a-proteobacteria)]
MNLDKVNTEQPSGIWILVDADACFVKDEVYRVAGRHALMTTVVANSPINIPRDVLIQRVVVGASLDAADDWIAERARRGIIVITADVPLAARCVKAGADVIAPNGRPFTPDSIGMALATRNLMDGLRSAGTITSGPPPFSARDRSAFLSALDLAVVRLKRAGMT